MLEVESILLQSWSSQNFKKILKRIDATISEILRPTTISGLTFIPETVSSSKNLNSPALEAGNGFSFFFLLPILFTLRVLGFS